MFLSRYYMTMTSPMLPNNLLLGRPFFCFPTISASIFLLGNDFNDCSMFPFKNAMDNLETTSLNVRAALPETSGKVEVSENEECQDPTKGKENMNTLSENSAISTDLA
jgi:hypothetical protein